MVHPYVLQDIGPLGPLPKNEAVYTATEVACGLAGALRKHANSTIWAGAVMQKMPENAKNAKRDNGD